MNAIKVDWFKKRQSLAQIYSSGLEYAFLSPNGKQCCAFVYCKDFLHDAVHAMIHNKSATIFGFTFDAKTMPPIDLTQTRLLLTNAKDPNFSQKSENILDFLHQIERRLKLVRTKISICENPPARYQQCGVIAVTGSQRWQNSPPMLSLYTLLLRLGFTHKKGDNFETTMQNVIKGKVRPYQSNDRNYLSSAKPKIDEILKIGYRPFFFGEMEKNYKPNVAVHTLHGSGGIVALARGYSKSVCKHWSRKALRDRLDGKIPEKKEEVAEIIT